MFVISRRYRQVVSSLHPNMGSWVIDGKKWRRRECRFRVHLSAEGRQLRDRRNPVFSFGREVLFQWSFLL